MPEKIQVKVPNSWIHFSKAGVSIIIMLLLIRLGFGVAWSTLLTILAYIAAGMLSRLPVRYGGSSVAGIELATTLTIITSIQYGPMAGSIVGAFSYGLPIMYTRESPSDVFVGTLGYIVIGLFAGGLYGMLGNLAMTALVIVILYDLIENLIYLTLGHTLIGCIKFSVIHIPAVYLITKYLGIILL